MTRGIKSEKTDDVYIKLDDQWHLRSDIRQWKLSKLQTDGKFRDRYYFANLENALKEYLWLHQRTSGAESVSDLIKLTKEVVASVGVALAPLNIKVMTK